MHESEVALTTLNLPPAVFMAVIARVGPSRDPTKGNGGGLVIALVLDLVLVLVPVLVMALPKAE